MENQQEEPTLVFQHNSFECLIATIDDIKTIHFLATFDTVYNDTVR